MYMHVCKTQHIRLYRNHVSSNSNHFPGVVCVCTYIDISPFDYTCVVHETIFTHRNSSKWDKLLCMCSTLNIAIYRHNSADTLPGAYECQHIHVHVCVRV